MCDANIAIELVKKALESICLDSELGEYDVTTFEFGVPKSERDKIEIINKFIDMLEKEYGVADEQMLYNLAESRYNINREKVKEIISKLREKDEIYMPRYGQFRLVKF